MKTYLLPAILLLLVLPVFQASAYDEYVENNRVIVIIDHARINYDVLEKIILACNESIEKYLIPTRINGSLIKVFIYRPWYEPNYIVMIYSLQLNNESMIIMMIYESNKSINTGYTVESIIYMEIGNLLRLGIISSIQKPLYNSIKIYSVEEKPVIPDIANIIIPRLRDKEVHTRPKWEFLSIEEIRGPYPAMEPLFNISTTTEKTTTTKSYRYGGSVETQGIDQEFISETPSSPVEIISDNTRYYNVLLSFLIALLASITIYIVLKKI